ncbi:hypothetical protein Efla_000341 [Eimeria flavescens]
MRRPIGGAAAVCLLDFRGRFVAFAGLSFTSSASFTAVDSAASSGAAVFAATAAANTHKKKVTLKSLILDCCWRTKRSGAARALRTLQDVQGTQHGVAKFGNDLPACSGSRPRARSQPTQTLSTAHSFSYLLHIPHNRALQFILASQHTKAERAIQQAVRAVLTEHASKRRKAEKGVSPLVLQHSRHKGKNQRKLRSSRMMMERFDTSSGTGGAEFLRETSTEVSGAEHAVVPPATEEPPPRQPQGRPTAENPEKAQQGEIVGQSEGTCEPLLTAARTSKSNEAIIITPHATTPPSIRQQGANRQVPLVRDTLLTNTDAARKNAQVQQQRADANTSALQLHQLAGVQRLSAAPKMNLT